MESEQKPSASSFLDRLKEATGVVATKAREGVEELQTKHELAQAYNDLGRTAADLVESGAVAHPELTERVEKIRALKAQLEAAPAAETPAEPAKPDAG
jgi:diphthamide synthase (EF-2-diphthine--ammonia ligase)